MRRYFILFLLVPFSSRAQDWMGEIMVGAAAYNGDLTQQAFSINRLRPAISLNVKYNTTSFFNFRGGISYARLTANDNRNKDEGLRSRNLNFTTNLLEVNIGAELNLLDPELFFGYPYLFGGVGVFYFDPFTFDKNNKKVFLHPLSTEGQGLPEYPDRKKYSKVQLCIPYGGGWKVRLKNNMEFSYEFGFRLLFTDYLDDVSRTYPSLEILANNKGETAAELSYRKQGIPFTEEGEARGNPKVKDLYFFNGVKLAINLNNASKIKNYRRHDF